MRQEGKQRDVSECDAMTNGRKFRQGETIDAQRGANVRLQFGLRMTCDFHSGELPQAREQHVVVRAGIFHQDCAAVRITKNRCGNS